MGAFRKWLSQRLLISTLVMLGICIGIPLFMVFVLWKWVLGPFSLVLFTLAVPITFIPSVIIFTRLLKRLLLHYRYIRPVTEREKVQNETIRQRLSLYLDTSSVGVIWVCIGLYSLFLYLTDNRW